jgi:hypothetical protein
MTPAEEYLFKAAQLSALAEDEANSTLGSGFRQLAEQCLRLADQLDRDSCGAQNPRSIKDSKHSSRFAH